MIGFLRLEVYRVAVRYNYSRPIVLCGGTTLGDQRENYQFSQTSLKGEGIDADQILTSLDKILNHQAFRSSPQLTAFLDYVVHEEVSGRGPNIKAYTVAIDALGREESFDPGSDATIRVVASRLRQTLERVYVDISDELPVHIDLIKGSYRPVFSSNAYRPGANDNTRSRAARHFQEPALTAISARRYHFIITCLLLLLVAMIVYVVWDIGVTAAGASIASGDYPAHTVSVSRPGGILPPGHRI